MGHLQIATFLAEVLDNKFKIGKFGFGLDPILDFLPIGGDVIALLLSLYIVWIAYHDHAPESLRARMLINVVFNFVLGLIPVVGWVASFMYRSNSMNLQLLKDWLAHQPIEGAVVDSEPVSGAAFSH